MRTIAKDIPLIMMSDGLKFMLQTDVVYNIGTDDYPISITVPKGYKTDLASIPSWAGLFGFRKLGRHNYASILHDYLFTTHLLTFEVTNAVFYQELRRSGVPSFRAACMALAVQVGGRRSYSLRL